MMNPAKLAAAHRIQLFETVIGLFAAPNRTSNDSVERRGGALLRNEADLSTSSTFSLAHRSCIPRSLEPIVRRCGDDHRTRGVRLQAQLEAQRRIFVRTRAAAKCRVGPDHQREKRQPPRKTRMQLACSEQESQQAHQPGTFGKSVETPTPQRGEIRHRSGTRSTRTARDHE